MGIRDEIEDRERRLALLLAESPNAETLDVNRVDTPEQVERLRAELAELKAMPQDD